MRFATNIDLRESHESGPSAFALCPIERGTILERGLKLFRAIGAFRVSMIERGTILERRGALKGGGFGDALNITATGMHRRSDVSGSCCPSALERLECVPRNDVSAVAEPVFGTRGWFRAHALTPRSCIEASRCATQCSVVVSLGLHACDPLPRPPTVGSVRSACVDRLHHLVRADPGQGAR